MSATVREALPLLYLLASIISGKKQHLCTCDRSPGWARKSEDGREPEGRAWVGTNGTLQSSCPSLPLCGEPLEGLGLVVLRGALPTGCVMSE